jgi:hypothetical protein
MPKDKRFLWMGLGLAAVAVRWMLGLRPDWAERYYANGLFSGIRGVFDNTSGLLPFPSTYILFFVLISLLANRLLKKDHQKRSFRQRARSLLKSAAAFLGGTVFLFLLLWGFNYARPDLENRLGLDIQPLPLESLRAALESRAAQLAASRNALLPDSAQINAGLLPKAMEDKLRQAVEKALSGLGIPPMGRVRGRELKPKGILLRFSASGVYNPFVGEGNVDAGLHPIQKPFTMAHEMAHGYGITDEGDCNFVAYLACANSEDAAIRYSGQLAYWRYLASSYLFYEPEKYAAFRKELPKGIRSDLDAINLNGQKYPDIFPAARDLAYDAYLRAQGISEGMGSYGRIVYLVDAWERKSKSEQRH